VPILDDELGALEEYLGRGGRMVAMLDLLDAGAGDLKSGLERLFAPYGVKARQEAMAVGAESAITGDRVIGMPSRGHVATRPLSRRQAIFVRACVLEKRTPSREGFKVTTLVEGTSGSYGETKAGGPSRGYDAGTDVKGPAVLGVAVEPERNAGTSPGREHLVVFADADFLANRYITRAEYRHSANLDLFLNCVNWMVGRRENIGIEPRPRETRRVTMTPSRRARVFWGAVGGPVVLMVSLALAVWRLRRR
jgi:hypothetical protein